MYTLRVSLACGLLLFAAHVTRGASCPWACSCRASAADCAHRGLLHVPKRLPTDSHRLDLQGNNISIVFQSDFQSLKDLKTLQLSENLIHTIERDAFLELNALERLRLNNNRLGHLPDGLFLRLRHLQRLDLSRNELTAISRRTFRGLTALKSLHLDGNHLKCIDEKALENLKSLEVLTLNNNNLTYLSLEPAAITRLNTLRLTDNPVVCDCRVARLSTAVRAAGILGVGARCQAPAALRGALLTDLEAHELICSGPTTAITVECSAEPRCPPPCRCTPEGTVDCREKLLSELPATIPHRATEIRLEQNEITEVPAGAFSSVKRVARIDLSNNKITKLAADAFSGLVHLTSLVLYGNKIKDLPSGIFHGLTSLQLLLLNSNEITCVRKDTFRDLQNLKLLSLYDNNIRSLPNGTFDALTGIQTLHLGRNPFACDCSLRWLAVYLTKNPIETSGAKCDSPKRMSRKRIDALREVNFKCKPGEESANACGMSAACPVACTCEYGARAVSVACTRAALTEVPRDLPVNTLALLMSDNSLGQIKSDGLFGRLPDLNKLDLRNNGITVIEDNAFDGAANIQELLLDGNLLQTVTDKMFFGLHSLSVLSLTDNKIKCITPGAFDHLTMLSTLNLESNPLDCTCHISWLPNWLRTRRLSPSATCRTPAALRDANLQHLEVSDFKCSPEDKGCLSSDYCPAQCTCTGTVVRCSRAQLTAVPQNIPKQTTELYLESNEITSILPDHIRHLTQLTRLDLSNNDISVITNNTFEGLTKLSTLIVSYNKLRCVQRDALKGLTQLRVLSLHGNNISMLADGVFRDLESISHVALGSNPLYCDCNARWLSEWVKNAGEYVEPGIARCSEPLAMRDKLILSTQSSAFVCKGKPPAEIISKCDSCYSNPCRNGGGCRPRGAGGHECVCARGYHGDSCQHQIDACYGSPCAHGVCHVLEEGRFHCSCQAGYTGARCEVNIDDCVNNKCQNNATCIDHLEGYSCKCAPGFMGEYCEKKIPFCTKEFNPCENGAVCTDHYSHYTCACPKGYSGQNCTVNADDCINHMCQNGATCVDGLDEYRCACAGGHAGRYCEAAPHAALGTSPCAHHDCVHGVCYLPQPRRPLQDDIIMERPLLSTANDYLCKCAPGYSGRLCEYLTSLTFSHNDSLVELEPLRTTPQANVTLVFSTTQLHGVLMYFGENEHLAVELFNGRIRISYDIGNHPTSTMYSFEMVSDGNYHKAELIAIKKNFTLKVDDGPARSIINEGAKEYLRLERPMYLGGVPEDIAKEAFSKWHLRNITSFKGCLKEAWINHKRVDYVNAVRVQRTSAGCGEDEPTSSTSATVFIQEDAGRHNQDPCVPNPCARGGRCVREEGSPSDYTCRCRAGTAGPQCELRASIGGAPVITQGSKNPPRKQVINNVQASPAAPSHKQQMPSEHAPSPPTSAAGACRKEATREVITEGSCRSRRAVRGARCVWRGARPGCPNGHCCAPRKTKKRKIRLVCADGTRYTKDIEIVRKCACGAKEYLRLERPMYLGGVPEDIAKEAFSKWHLRNITSFKGCLKEAWINHKRVDYVNAVRVQRTSAGCGEDEPTSSTSATVFIQEDAGRHNQDPCVPNPCARGGRCVREEGSPSDYTCRCRAGTAGPQCELRASIGGAPVITQGSKNPPRKQVINNVQASPAAPSHKQQMPSEHAPSPPTSAAGACRKEATREMITEGSCRSRRAVRGARCVWRGARPGCPNGHCCAPRKTKKRKIRLVCADGTRYTKDIEIVRKCACGAKEYLRLERPMYLGGVPEDIAKEAFSKWHLRNITSFKGCLKEAWINHKRVDYVNAVRVQRTSAGCGEDEPTSSTSATVFIQEDAGRHNQDPCVPNPCARGGRCVREEGSPSDYTCRCRAGTAGPQCELRASIGGAPVITQGSKNPPRKQVINNVQASPAAPSHKQQMPSEHAPSPPTSAAGACRKEATREVITEGSCRSRRAVRGARCVWRGARPGCPNGHCCAPRKTKKRKIRLVCADGTRYTKDIEIVRKCACGAKEYLRLERPMYLGGVPEDIAKEAFSKWHLRNITSFKGCLKEAWINHKRVDYVNAVRVQRTSAGCGEDEPTSSTSATVFIQEDAGRHNQDPCVPNPCARGGRCVREEGSPSDYTCRCRAGTAGPQCELRASIGGAPVITQGSKNPPRKQVINNVQASPAAPSHKQQMPSEHAPSPPTSAAGACRKEATREVITEGSCRSRRAVRGARCVWRGARPGCPNGHCCAPRKTKKRKIRLVCADGTRYTKDIEIVRKCACGAKEYLRLERPMYLGGVPEDIAKEAFSKWHLRNITSFKGCLKEAWINHKRVDYVNAVRVQRTSAGCGEDEPTSSTSATVFIQEDAGRHNQDPCVPNPCARGGRCVREEGSPSDYTCRCRAGTAGPQCELRASIGGAPVITQGSKNPPRKQVINNVQASPAAPSHKQQMPSEHAPSPPTSAAGACRKEATREVITEGSCRSRRAVRGARCVWRGARPGCPNGHCCAPRKTKKRKIRLVCADGTRYTKDIEIVRKCACGKKCPRNAPFH